MYKRVCQEKKNAHESRNFRQKNVSEPRGRWGIPAIQPAILASELGVLNIPILTHGHSGRRCSLTTDPILFAIFTRKVEGGNEVVPF